MKPSVPDRVFRADELRAKREHAAVLAIVQALDGMELAACERLLSYVSSLVWANRSRARAQRSVSSRASNSAKQSKADGSQR